MQDTVRSNEPPPGIATGPVTDWIAAAVEGVAPPLRWTAVGKGRSNLTYLITDAADRMMILRRPPLGVVSESAHDVQREHSILAALHRVGQPVPRPFALCTDPAVSGAPFYVMERLEGVVADDPDTVAARLTVPARRRAGIAIAHGLAELHAVDTGAAGLGALGRGGNDYACRQVRRWTRQWRAMGVEDARLEDLVVRFEAAEPPRQTGVAIVHGDYAPHNLVLAPDGGLAGILDWELATLGEPLADLAWMLMWWPETPQQAMPGAEPVSHLEGFPSRSELVSAYIERTGRSADQLPFWLALSYWKLAIIVEGVHQRWLANPLNGGRGVHLLATGRERIVAAALDAVRAVGL